MPEHNETREGTQAPVVVEVRQVSPKAEPSFVQRAMGWTKLVAAVVGVVFVLTQWSNIGKLITRLMEDATEISIGQITVKAPTPGGQTTETHWAAIYRIKEAITIRSMFLRANPQSSDVAEAAEYVQFEALKPVNLGNGHIGDRNTVLSFDVQNLALTPAQTVRIYTCVRNEGLKQKLVEHVLGCELADHVVFADTPKFVAAAAAPKKRADGDRKPYTCVKPAAAAPSPPANVEQAEEAAKKASPGIFKAGHGEGDRIVLIGHGNRILLDVDYWQTMARPKPQQSAANEKENAAGEDKDNATGKRKGERRRTRDDPCE